MSETSFSSNTDGCQSLCEVEDSLKARAFKLMDILPYEFPGEIPKPTWLGRDEARVERNWRRPDKSKVLAGIVAFLMEQIIEKYSNKCGHEDGVFAIKHGELYEVRVPDLFFIPDPACPPMDARSIMDAKAWVQFGENRFSSRAFVDARHWVVLDEPNWRTATCREDAEEIGNCWSKLENLSNSRLVIRSKSGRKDRKFKAASEIAKELDNDLYLILHDAKLPIIGTQRYNELKKHVLRQGMAMTEEQRNKVTEKDIRSWVGDPKGVRNRSIDALLKDFRAVFPKTEN